MISISKCKITVFQNFNLDIFLSTLSNIKISSCAILQGGVGGLKLACAWSNVYHDWTLRDVLN